MRFKTLAIVGFILLGIVTFSVYSGYNSDNITDEKNVTATYYHNSVSILLDNSESSVFEGVRLEKSSIEAPEPCDQFETIIVNPLKFRELASNGTVNLTLAGEEYELKLLERETGNSNVTSYMGYIAGKPQSSVFFTVKNDSIEGCINVDFYTLSYGIASTDEKYNGKIVHILWRCYSEGGENEIKKHNSLDPLEFYLQNSDKRSHEIHIELFDFYNKSVFKETYTMKPGDEIFSPEISVEPGYYRYNIILDDNSTFESRVTANYAANLGGSEKLHLTIRDDPDNPIEFMSEIA
jgi:hypothetical protein